jgi:lysophospholipase L1-like esterase
MTVSRSLSANGDDFRKNKIRSDLHVNIPDYKQTTLSKRVTLQLTFGLLTIFFATSNTWVKRYVQITNGFTHPICGWLMNVLVIGDEHTYGYGLSGGNLSYIGHFIRQISRAGQAVSVEAYAHLTMTQTIATLGQLPLNRYDLIVLQLDHTLVQATSSQLARSSGVTIPVFPDSVKYSKQTARSTFSRRMKTLGTALLSFVRPPRDLKLILILLNQLRPYRHNVLLLTPFSHLEPVSRWLRKRSRAVWLREAEKRLVSVFDTDSVIQPREEYFLANDNEHLSAIGHELLGRSLYDFYQSAPTIVTIQAFRRG